MSVHIEWTGTPGDKLDGVDVHVGYGVVVELATLNAMPPYGWGVWGVRIDGALYREPRDLDPEPLHDGPMLALVERACEQASVAAKREAS